MADYLRLTLAVVFVVLGAFVALFLVYWLTIGFALGLGIVAAFAVVGWLIGARADRRAETAGRERRRLDRYAEGPPRTDPESPDAGRSER